MVLANRAERMTRRAFLPRAAMAGMGIGLARVNGFAQAQAVKATPVRTFLDSMGVCSSITGRGETLAGTIASMKYSGLRFIRCGIEDGNSVEDMIELHRQTGVRIAYGLLSGGTDLARLLDEAGRLARAGALLAIEGNNEPNNWGVTYQGEFGGRDQSWLPVAKLQRDLYTAVKADPVLRDHPVWHISESGAQTDNCGLQYLTVPEGTDCLMPAGTHYADYANCHNYITHPSWTGLHNNQTWLPASPGPDCPVDGLYGNYGRTWAKRFAGYGEAELRTLPRVTTETGYPVGDLVTEEIQARLFLNLYLSQFKRGWSHTSIYLLRTRSNEPAHHTYALFKIDEAPKQAAHYLHNLTSILADRGEGAPSRSLGYSIANQPETVHDLLLQRGDGTMLLVLWGECFEGGVDEVTVDLGAEFGTVRIYDPTQGTSPVGEHANERRIQLRLTDHPVILELA